MSEEQELRHNPFCGHEVHRDYVNNDVYRDIVGSETSDCCTCCYTFDMSDEEWNNRPIEDAKDARIAELEELRLTWIEEAGNYKDKNTVLLQQLAEANKTIEARTEAVRILDNEATGLEKQLAEANDKRDYYKRMFELCGSHWKHELAEVKRQNLRQRVEDIRMCSDPLYPAGFKIKDVVVTKDFKDNLITNLEFIFEVPCSDFIEGMTDKLLPSRDIVDHLIEHGVEGNNE